ncbi:MAG TPA: DUF5335 family protein [Pyrinomonadaceae bacterium]|nr:DUF5335 family protein [Pyrinomonadaceae bacterium]
MPTREIPRDEWITFFDGFSRQHEGWLVTVEVLGQEIGAQIEARELPLEGVTADLGKEGEDTISIILGASPEEHVTHIINAPTHVRLEQTAEGANATLQIESAGEATLIRFRSTMLPEMVDGAVLE